MSAPLYPCDASEYELCSAIGVGSFSTVFRAKLKSREEFVAIKVLDLGELNTTWEEVRQEITIMRQMKHPNIVPIHCAFVEREELWIVMPFMAGGSCANVLKARFPKGIKDEAVVATILFEALKGLEYCHKDAKIHRDVKSGNILISGTGDVQISDFGVSAVLMDSGDRKSVRKTFVGTPCCMAPEVMEQTHGYNCKADIWSFGITAMELAYGRAPYADYPPMKAILKTLEEDPPTCDVYNDESYKFSKHFHSMISKCLRKDPESRPSATKLLEHKFFKGAEDRSVIVARMLKGMKLKEYPITSEEHAARVSACKLSAPPKTLASWVFDDDVKAVLEGDAAAPAPSCGLQPIPLPIPLQSPAEPSAASADAQPTAAAAAEAVATAPDPAAAPAAPAAAAAPAARAVDPDSD